MKWQHCAGAVTGVFVSKARLGITTSHQLIHQPLYGNCQVAGIDECYQTGSGLVCHLLDQAPPHPQQTLTHGQTADTKCLSK